MDRLEIFAQLPPALLPWYAEHHRPLPWREDREPYHVWLSEIMLQQTRVEAVKGYYSRFLENLPSVEALAACDDEKLHKLWEGLGYYSRVRNLKRAAQEIVRDYGGEFPRTYEQVRALPGIGDYTAGAICSIAYDLPTPAVDGNVLRLAARLTSDATPIDLPQVKAALRQELAAVYPKEAGTFTQSLMELGATLCGPNRAPDCEACPCRGFCRGYAEGTAAALPVKSPRREKKVEERTVFILRCGDRYALERRPDTGLLAGLWQFPNVPGRMEAAEAVALLAQQGIRTQQVLRQVARHHIFTHIRWNLTGIYLEVAETGGPYRWLTPEQIRREAALPTAFRQFWEEPDDV